MPVLFVFRGDGATFFARHDPRMILGGPVDLAFLDGLPLFEATLRDFCNLERVCRPGSVVLINNCLPVDGAMAGRDPEDHVRRAASAHPDWWTGDAWKLITILQTYRPDLTLCAFDAQPSGLLAVTGLDPTSGVIAERYQSIVAEFRDLGDEDTALARSQAALTVHGTADMAEVLRQHRPAAASPPSFQDKPSTYRFIDPALLPVIDFPTLAGGLAEGRLPEPPEGSRAFFRAPPAFIEDPAASGIIQPFGADTIRYGGASVLAVQDAVLVGYRSILTPSGLLVHDETQAEPWDMGRLADKLSRTDDDFLNELTGLSPAGHNGEFTLDRRDRETIMIEDPVVVLCSNEPSNYGSWIYRILPKLHSIRRLGLDGLRILVHAPEPHHRAYLEAFGIPWGAVIHHETDRIYHIRRAIIPTMRNILPYLDPGGRQLFEELRRRHAAPRADRRLYISRLNWSQSGRSVRVLMNEAELIARLESEGFEVIEPEGVTLSEQVRVFSSARLIVGPAGSALYNVVFCQPGTKIIDIESEPYWVALHSCLFASLGHPYGIVVGSTDPTDPRPVHKRWTVDIGAVTRRVNQFDSRR